MQFYIFSKSYFLQVLKSLKNTNLLFHKKKIICKIFSWSLQVKHYILVDSFYKKACNLPKVSLSEGEILLSH